MKKLGSLWGDFKVLYHLLLAPSRGDGHQERLDNFYRHQLPYYDSFRSRLLHGRDRLFDNLRFPEGGVWVDMGAGTGMNLEWWGDRLSLLKKIYLVDASPAMLGAAQKRVAQRGWKNVEIVQADATGYQLPEKADLITFSYSLTMIPDWFAAIDNAHSMLRPGGQIGAADFYVGRKFPEKPMASHSSFTRWFWWFNLFRDNVFVSPDHIPYLQRRFDSAFIFEGFGKVPYLPIVRVPYYVMIGNKGAGCSQPPGMGGLDGTAR